jgi:hypothetical protein
VTVSFIILIKIHSSLIAILRTTAKFACIVVLERSRSNG